MGLPNKTNATVGQIRGEGMNANLKKIEELLESVETKVHAGEWIRLNQVRILLNKMTIWLMEQHQKDLNEIRELAFGETVQKESEEE